MIIYISYLKNKKNRIKLFSLRFVTCRNKTKKTNTQHTEHQQGITETHRAAINSSTNKDYVSLLETWDTQHVASRPGAQNNLFKSILLKDAQLLSKRKMF